jgi:hypothetical protein
MAMVSVTFFSGLRRTLAVEPMSVCTSLPLPASYMTPAQLISTSMGTSFFLTSSTSVWIESVSCMSKAWAVTRQPSARSACAAFSRRGCVRLAMKSRYPSRPNWRAVS